MKKPATTFDLTALQTNARNPQITTPERLERLRQSLADLPKMMRLRPLVYDPDTMTVLGGNKRLTQLLALGYTTVPAEWVASAHDFTPEERRRFIIADNVGFGTWDAEILTEDYTEEELEAWGLQPDDWADDPDEAEAPAATDDGYAPPPDLHTDIVPGDLITIGPHRLLCGDSTNADDVAKVLNGDKPFLMVTDPPYGVEYDPEWRNDDLAEANIAVGKVQNDDKIDWSAAWALSPSTVTYVWCASWYLPETMISLKSTGFVFRSLLIWRKQHFAISRGHYHWQHEPCCYLVKKGKTAQWIGDRSQSTIWEINNGLSQKGGRDDSETSTGHGTQKPVECMARPIKNHEGDVYDPFLGSGTTIVAAHQLNRRCYGLEIDPHYCQIIIDRMHKLDPTLPITINGTPYTPGE